MGQMNGQLEAAGPRCKVCGDGCYLHDGSDRGGQVKTICVVDSRPRADHESVRRRRECTACRRRFTTVQEVRPGVLAHLKELTAAPCSNCHNGRVVNDSGVVLAGDSRQCGSALVVVIDTRPTHHRRAIRRRHHCEACGRRYTSLEEAVPLEFTVVDAMGPGQERVATREGIFCLLQQLSKGLEVGEEMLYLVLDRVERKILAELSLEITFHQLTLVVAKELAEVKPALALRWLAWFSAKPETLLDFLVATFGSLDVPARTAEGAPDDDNATCAD